MPETIKLKIIGCGSMVPTKDRSPAAFYVEAGGKKILMDGGPGTLRRMTDTGLAWRALDAAFLSHFHTDHAADVFSLIHTRFVADNYENLPSDRLMLIGPQNLEENFRSWRQIFWPEPDENYPIDFYEGVQKLDLDGVRIETFRVQHVPWFQSLGIKISFKGKSLVYTGDIGGSNDTNQLSQIIAGTDLLITEASYEEPTPNHFSFSQVEELARKSGVKKVLIVHLRPSRIEQTAELVKRNANFILGEDGLSLEI